MCKKWSLNTARGELYYIRWATVSINKEKNLSLVRGKGGAALGSSNELMHMFTRQLYISRIQNCIEENVYK